MCFVNTQEAQYPKSRPFTDMVSVVELVGEIKEAKLPAFPLMLPLTLKTMQTVGTFFVEAIYNKRL